MYRTLSAALLFFTLGIVVTSPVIAQDFRRGDVDGDGISSTIHDAILALGSILPTPGGIVPTPCQNAVDFNDDDVITIADAVELLLFMIGDGPPPPAPGPTLCGPDPTPSSQLGCDEYSCIPTPLSTIPEVTLEVTSAFGSVGELVTVELSQNAAPGFGLRGVTVNICHDPSIASIVSVDGFGRNFDLGGELVNSDIGHVIIATDSWSGWTLPSLAFNQLEPLPVLATITYQLIAPGVSTLEFCPVSQRTEISDRLGSNYGIPITIQGEIGTQDFRRGDANLDGTVDIGDAVFTLEGLFSGGDAPSCQDSADSNDDGLIDIADGVATLNFLFAAGPPPSSPGTSDCGADPTPDQLTCNQNGC